MAAPRSNRFDDIYFSPDDGLAETTHVFLAGNDLPARWAHRDHFVVLELGFGTGLGMLATARAFCDQARAGQSLHLYSIEKYPLAAPVIADALARWRRDLDPCLGRMLADYPLRIGGWHTLWLDPRVRLTIIIDDVHHALSGLHEPCDAFFLDGFAPAKNPDMWDPSLFKRMADLANDGASFATFTAASGVRNGLMQAGFSVEKVKGYGRKRDMLRGKIARNHGIKTAVPRTRAQRIVVDGAGLAGSAVAYVLRARGHRVSVIDDRRDHVRSASLNARGMVNPRFAPKRSPLADYFMSAFARFERFARTTDPVIGYQPHGALHLLHDPRKAAKLLGALDHWGWDHDHMRAVDAHTASALAGVGIDQPCLYLPDAGSVSPADLCHLWRGGGYADRADDPVPVFDGCDHRVMARLLGSGVSAAAPLPPRRMFGGQVTYAACSEISHALTCAVHYGGYCAPSITGMHVVGSTFHRDDTATHPSAADDQDNLGALHRHVPSLASIGTVIGSRRAVRVNTPDSAPLVGALVWPETTPTWISAAHGSHGIISALMAADILADRIEHRSPALPRMTLAVIDPDRFRSVRWGDSILPADE